MDNFKDTYNNSNDKNYDFHLDPSLLNIDVVKHIGIEKSSNSIIVEVCNDIITQTIYRNAFSDKTISPLRKQISDILSQYTDKKEEQKIIKSIITCINGNINKIFEHCEENSFLFQKNADENTKVDELINLASGSQYIQKIFKDQTGKIYTAVRQGKDKHLEVILLDSIKFKWYLAKLYRDNFKSSISESSINTAITSLAAEAEFNGDVIPLHLKVAWGSVGNGAKDDCIYYDMCDAQGRIIEISKEAWRIIDGTIKDAPILFKRFNQQPQVEPNKSYPSDIFEKLLSLTNVKNQKHRHLLSVYIISTLIPEIDHPILTIPISTSVLNCLSI